MISSKILIIEDDENLRLNLVDLFNLVGFSAYAAADGKEGFELIMSIKPDVVICDVEMPGQTGFELLNLVNITLKDELAPAFLFLTGKSNSEDLRQGMSLGADDYIFKPFNQNDIVNSVKLRIEKRKQLLASSKPNIDHAEKIAIPVEDGLELIPFKDIIKCKADRAYCNFHLKSGEVKLVSKPLAKFEEILTQNDFIKIHKSCIVNLRCIVKYVRGKGGMIQLEDQSIEPVGPSRKDELLERIGL